MGTSLIFGKKPLMKALLTSIILVMSFLGWTQDFQETYKVSDDSPSWIKYMYGDTVNLFALREQFDEYYEVHPFEKNQHTQYFKRLMKEYWTDVDTEGFITERLNNPAPAQETAAEAPKKRRFGFG